MFYPSPYEARDSRIWAAWCEHSGDSGPRHCNYPSTHPYWKFVIKQEKVDKGLREVETYRKGEKNHFTDYLFRNGWKPYRLVRDGNLFSKKYLPIPSLDFSSMMTGMCDIRFEKGDQTIVWGMSEHGKPHTLIYPRPSGIIDDDAMNNFLASHTFDQILQHITT